MHFSYGVITLLLPFFASRSHGFHYAVPTSSVLERSKGAFSTPFSVRAVSVSLEGDAGISSGSSISPDMKAYASGYSTVLEEVPCSVCSPSEGKLPNDLIGTYFKSGPAMFSAGSLPPPKNSAVQPKTSPVPDGVDSNRMVKHPFEGDGAVLAVTFPGDGTATTRFRYVRTNAFTIERKKGEKLYNGMESTRLDGPESGAGQGNDFPLPLFRHHLQPGLNKKRKNTSNTRAVYWAKKLVTLWEGGLPYKLDSLALSTEGRSQLGGVLKEDSPLGAKAAYDSSKENMLFYSNRQDSGSSLLTVYEFNSKFRLVRENGGKIEAKLPGLALLSDFAVSEHYSIFVQPPVTTNGMQFMLSKEPGKTTAVSKEGALLHLVPRPGSGEVMKTFSVPYDGASDADLQFCNAYETDGGKIVVFDAIRSDSNTAGTGKSKASEWPWATCLTGYASTSSKKSLWRYSVNLDTKQISKKCISKLQSSFGVVNPAVSGQKHRYIYASVGGMGSAVAPPQGILKFDCDSDSNEMWLPQEYEFCGEPMYASRKGGDASSQPTEDDGYILSVLYNGQSQESQLIVLRANDIKSGPVTRIPLGLRIPHGYFGCFSTSEETNWSAEEIERRAKLADKMETRGNMWNEVKSDFSGLGLRLDDFDEYFGDFL